VLDWGARLKIDM